MIMAKSRENPVRRKTKYHRKMLAKKERALNLPPKCIVKEIKRVPNTCRKSPGDSIKCIKHWKFRSRKLISKANNQ